MPPEQRVCTVRAANNSIFSLRDYGARTGTHPTLGPEARAVNRQTQLPALIEPTASLH